jgi:two-component system, response regulator PdtaR
LVKLEDATMSPTRRPPANVQMQSAELPNAHLAARIDEVSTEHDADYPERGESRHVGAPRSHRNLGERARRWRGREPMKALHVLVVEDDMMSGMLFAEMLVEMGHDVCAIETTEAGAVTAADRCRPDLMIVNATLDGGSGVSIIEEILRTGPVPHMFISDATVRGDEPGAVVLQKPFREPDLVWAMQRALGAGSTC